MWHATSTDSHSSRAYMPTSILRHTDGYQSTQFVRTSVRGIRRVSDISQAVTQRSVRDQQTVRSHPSTPLTSQRLAAQAVGTPPASQQQPAANRPTRRGIRDLRRSQRHVSLSGPTHDLGDKNIQHLTAQLSHVQYDLKRYEETCLANFGVDWEEGRKRDIRRTATAYLRGMRRR